MRAKHRIPRNRRGNFLRAGLPGPKTYLGDLGRGHNFFSECWMPNTHEFCPGRYKPKYFRQLPDAIPPKGDVLVEAGRLAVEYLVSRGLLPLGIDPITLDRNRQSKKYNVHIDDGQTSSRTCAGRSGFYTRPGGGGHHDNFVMKDNVKTIRGGFYQRCSSQSNRLHGGAGSRLNKTRELSREEDDTIHGCNEEKRDGNCDAMENHRQEDGIAPKKKDEAEDKKLPNQMNAESMPCDTTNVWNSKMNENKDSVLEHSSGKNEVIEETKNQVGNDILWAHRYPDLLSHCKLYKIPTKKRSALSYTNARSERSSYNKFDNNPATESPTFLNKSNATGKDTNSSVSVSAVLASSPRENGAGCRLDMCDETQTAIVNIKIGTSEKSSDVPCDLSNIAGDHHSVDIREVNDNLQEQSSEGCQMIVDTSESACGSSMLRGDSNVILLNHVQEKELFPRLFKTCDLNLTDSSDMSDVKQGSPASMHPSTTINTSEVLGVDVDLTISNSCRSIDYASHGILFSNVKEYDLDNVPAHHEIDTSPSCQLSAHGCASSEVISTPNKNYSDVSIQEQDAFDGSVIPAFISTFSNSSALDFYSRKDEIDLHNEELMMADDDSIYMSLGEIPISTPYIQLKGFSPSWSQPSPPDFEKHFG